MIVGGKLLQKQPLAAAGGNIDEPERLVLENIQCGLFELLTQRRLDRTQKAGRMCTRHLRKPAADLIDRNRHPMPPYVANGLCFSVGLRFI